MDKEDVVEGVNLPRWGLKLVKFGQQQQVKLCKFTPLGFETRDIRDLAGLRPV